MTYHRYPISVRSNKHGNIPWLCYIIIRGYPIFAGLPGGYQSVSGVSKNIPLKHVLVLLGLYEQTHTAQRLYKWVNSIAKNCEIQHIQTMVGQLGNILVLLQVVPEAQGLCEALNLLQGPQWPVLFPPVCWWNHIGFLQKISSYSHRNSHGFQQLPVKHGNSLE